MKIINNNENCIFEIAESDEIKIDEKYIVGVIKELIEKKYKFTLNNSYHEYFINFSIGPYYSNENNILFQELKLHRSEFQKKILGYSDPNIAKMSTNANITTIEVKRIRYKIRYKTISDEYFGAPFND